MSPCFSLFDVMYLIGVRSNNKDIQRERDQLCQNTSTSVQASRSVVAACHDVIALFFGIFERGGVNLRTISSSVLSPTLSQHQDEGVPLDLASVPLADLPILQADQYLMSHTRSC